MQAPVNFRHLVVHLEFHPQEIRTCVNYAGQILNDRDKAIIGVREHKNLEKARHNNLEFTRHKNLEMIKHNSLEVARHKNLEKEHNWHGTTARKAG